MGVLNVTPDSFSDGGLYTDIDTAVSRAMTMIDQGADIIDIGGESTFVNRDDVSIEEELERVLPVIQTLKEKRPNTQISIDTYKSEVAKQVLAAGATIVNDVTAGRGDTDMFAVATEAQCPIVLMYAKDETSRTTTDEREYEDVVDTIKTFLEQRIHEALAAGIKKHNIILDPGLGFFISGKAQYSYEILAQLERITALGYPVLVSPSRKSFLAGREQLAPADRLPGTIASSAIAATCGATIIRTHDVLEVRRACEIAKNIQTYVR